MTEPQTPAASEAEIATLVERGRHGIEEGNVDEARKAYDDLQSRAPDHKDTLLLGALLAAVDEDYERSRACLDIALERYPDDLVVLIGAASLLLEVHMDPAAALPLLEEAAAWLEEAEPGDEEMFAALYLDVLLRLSEAHGQLADFEAARESAEMAYENSGSPLARFALARARYALGEVDEAWGDLQAVLATEADDAEVQHLVARTALARGDEARADEAFTRAAALDPEGYPKPPRLDRARFEEKMNEALAGLPEPLSTYLADMPVELHDLPKLDALRTLEPPMPPSVPLLLAGERAAEAPFELMPERLVVYQRNVEALATSEDDLDDVFLSALAQAFTLFFQPLATEEDQQAFFDEEFPFEPEGEA